MQFILRRRLLHGIYEIRQGRRRIDVALDYGFDTYAGFYRAFQREFGCIPSYYLQQDRVRRPYRINFTKEENMIVTHKKATEILKCWQLEQEIVSDIYFDSGEKSDRAFYVGEGFVLKYTANLGEVKTHIALAKAIARIGLQASVPVRTTDQREYVQDGELYFFLTERMVGKQMNIAQLYGEDGASKARFVGEIIGQLHLALEQVDAVVNDVNMYESVDTWALPKAKEILHLPQGFCDSYLREFGQLYDRLPKQIIHRDPNPSNVILSKDRFGFIDFDLSERNLRIFDPCYAATAVLSESFASAEESKLQQWFSIYQNLILGYDSVVKLTKEERVAVPYVLLANQLICVAWFAEQEKYPEMYETNQKMTRWLLQNREKLEIS